MTVRPEPLSVTETADGPPSSGPEEPIPSFTSPTALGGLLGNALEPLPVIEPLVLPATVREPPVVTSLPPMLPDAAAPPVEVPPQEAPAEPPAALSPERRKWQRSWRAARSVWPGA